MLGIGGRDGNHCVLGNRRTMNVTTECSGLGVEMATTVCLGMGEQWEDNGRNQWMLGIGDTAGNHCVLRNGGVWTKPLNARDWG